MPGCSSPLFCKRKLLGLSHQLALSEQEHQPWIWPKPSQDAGVPCPSSQLSLSSHPGRLGPLAQKQRRPFMLQWRQLPQNPFCPLASDTPTMAELRGRKDNCQARQNARSCPGIPQKGHLQCPGIARSHSRLNGFLQSRMNNWATHRRKNSKTHTADVLLKYWVYNVTVLCSCIQMCVLSL